jgi:hypothetical protein
VRKTLVRFCEGLECDSWYGGHIVAPPGNQVDNGENKPLPKPRGVSFLLKKNPTVRDRREVSGNVGDGQG